MRRKIKVMVVDDSATMRQFLKSTLEAQPDMQVVSAARDAYSARDQYLAHRPDVITLDIEMPGVDGLTFLEKLMASHPTPVVMISGRTRQGAESTFRALRLGAVDFIAKPMQNLQETLPLMALEVVGKVRAAATIRPEKLRRAAPSALALSAAPKILIEDVVPLNKVIKNRNHQVWLIGASTGGTVALEEIISHLPADCPPIAVVQHMPPNFTTAFADRLNQKYRPAVVEAAHGMRLDPGMVAIAPGGIHLLLEADAQGYYLHLLKGPPVNRHKPSVDVLFRSGVNSAGAAARAVLLTGMGDDGARGMKDLFNAGCLTIAQDEASSVVYGMPKAAADLGAARQILPLDMIAPAINAAWGANNSGN